MGGQNMRYRDGHQRCQPQREDQHSPSFIDELEVFEKKSSCQDKGKNSYYGSHLLLTRGGGVPS